MVTQTGLTVALLSCWLSGIFLLFRDSHQDVGEVECLVHTLSDGLDGQKDKTSQHR